MNKKSILIIGGVIVIAMIVIAIMGFDFSGREQANTNCQKGSIVEGFTGDNFGGDLLWYGVHDWKTNPETLDGFETVFDGVGMEIARFDIYWGKLEPEKGFFNWTSTDALLNTVNEDTPVLFTIFSTSEWGSEYNNVRELGSEYYGNQNDPQIYNRPPSSIPINMQDYMDFLDALVSRYGGRVEYWMIENEVHSATTPYKWKTAFQLPPNLPPISRFWIGTKEEYVELLKNSYSKIKQVDPQAVVMATNFMKHETNEEFTDYILENGMDYSDILALNLYQCPQDDIDRITEMRTKMNILGYDKPIWVTEHGEIDIDYHTENMFKESFDSPEELKLQSEELLKRHVLAFSVGVRKIFRLSLTRENEEWKATSKFNHMSLTFDTKGMMKKPAFYTNKLMIEKLKDFVSVETIDYGIYKFRFSDKEPVIVLWSDYGDKTIDLSDYVDSSDVRIIHIITELNGNNNPVYYIPEKIISVGSVPATESPVFIEGI